MGVVDVDLVRPVVDQLLAFPPPLDLRQWVGVNVTGDVVRRPGPDEHAPVMVASEPRLVCRASKQRTGRTESSS